MRLKNSIRILLGKFFYLSIFLFIPILARAAEDDTAGENWLNKITGTGMAQNWQDMFINFAKTFPDIERLISAVAYVIGAIFAVRAMYYLKIYGELRTMMSSNASLRPPLTYLLVASVFIFLPTSMETILFTAFNVNEATPLSYAEETKSQYFGDAMRAILGFIQVIGYIAFIRGWMMISHTAQQTGRDSVGKGLTHIIGGILAINIVGTRDILWNTFGWA